MRPPQQYFQITLGRLSIRQWSASMMMSSMSSSVHGGANSSCCDGWSTAYSEARVAARFFPSVVLSAFAALCAARAARNAGRDAKLTPHPPRLQRQGPCVS